MFAVEGTVDGDVRRMVLIVAGQPLPPPVQYRTQMNISWLRC